LPELPTHCPYCDRALHKADSADFFRRGFGPILVCEGFGRGCRTYSEIDPESGRLKGRLASYRREYNDLVYDYNRLVRKYNSLRKSFIDIGSRGAAIEDERNNLLARNDTLQAQLDEQVSLSEQLRQERDRLDCLFDDETSLKWLLSKVTSRFGESLAFRYGADGDEDRLSREQKLTLNLWLWALFAINFSLTLGCPFRIQEDSPGSD